MTFFHRIGLAAKAAADFDEAFRRVAAISDLGWKEQQALQEALLGLARQLPISAQQVTLDAYNAMCDGVAAEGLVDHLRERYGLE
jgi:hypothetical protein